MSDRLVWDKLEDRIYETGVDRGVLYPPDVLGVPWSGLTGVAESQGSGQTSSYYFDGIKYQETRSTPNFSATLRALTYPDEFLPFDGYEQVNPGLYVDEQPIKQRFGISYRTRVGSALDEKLGYKVHILYNLLAAPSGRNHSTIAAQVSADEFSWTLTGVPMFVPGFRPTPHFVVDSRYVEEDALKRLEDILYGYSPIGGSTDILDGGTPFSSVTITPPLMVDGGLASSFPDEIIDGGTALSAGATGPMDAPGPRLPTIDELLEITMPV